MGIFHYFLIVQMAPNRVEHQKLISLPYKHTKCKEIVFEFPIANIFVNQWIICK